MSNVPKGKRGESSAEFLRMSRVVKLATVRNCTKIPKKYGFGLAQPMIATATNAKTLIVYANSIRPKNQRQVQDRAESFEKAKAMLAALCSDIDDLQEMKDEISIASQVYDEWTAGVATLIVLLNGVMDSDRKRYKDLPD